MKFRVLIISVLLLLMSSTFVKAEGQNLAENPGFEEEESGVFSIWAKGSWEDKGQFSADKAIKHSGKNSACIINNDATDSRYKQTIVTQGNTYYKISCWIKTENVGPDGKGANISIENLIDTSEDIKGTSDWRYVELYGKTDKNQQNFTLTLGLGGYSSVDSGKAWFDDVSVEQLSGPPADKNVVNLFNSQTSADSGASKSNTTLIIIIIMGVILLATIGYFIFSGKKSDPAKGIALASDGAPVPLEVKVQRLILNKNDFLIMGVMTFVYLIVALYNLGGFKAPQTSYQPMSPGESFVVDFGRQVNLSRIYFYDGATERKYDNTKYKVESFDAATGNFTNLTYIEKKDFYVWKYQGISVTTNKIKIIVDAPGGTLNEMGFYESGSKTPVTGFKITDIRVNEKTDIGKVANLFDEQDMLEYAPSYMTGTYFDEIYHARTAYEHLHGMEPFETTHPPLGKIIISIGIAIFGMVPFGWRIMGTLFGAAMIPLMYLFGKKLFGKSFYGFCAAFLMMFDFMHFAQTRIATIDSYGTFFVILMYYFMCDYFVNKSYVLGYKQSLKFLFLSGLFFGIGAASKWIGVYAGGGLALLFFLTKIFEYVDYSNIVSTKKSKKYPWVNSFTRLYVVNTGLFCILFFILIPVIIYTLSYIPYLFVHNGNYELGIAWKNSVDMFKYHGYLQATHPFQSPWYDWPLDIKPMWFYNGSDLPAGRVSTIASFGNPAIWWIGLVAIFAAAVIAIYKRDRKMIVVFTAMAFQFLPWVFISRIVFIYHYFSTVPFLILAIVYVIANLIERNPRAKYIVYGYLALVAVLFIMFYPVISGFETSKQYVDSLKLLKTWIF